MSMPCSRFCQLTCLVLGLTQPSLGGEGKPAPGTDRHGDPLPAAAVARLGTIRFRLAETIAASALSPDGKLLATYSNREFIHLMDTTTGKETRRLHTGPVSLTAMAFTPDGKRIATVGSDNHIRFFDAVSGAAAGQIQTAPQGMQIGRLFNPVFSSDGKRLTASNDSFGQINSVYVWDVEGCKQLGKFDLVQNTRLQATLSHNGKLLATWGGYSPRAGEARVQNPAQPRTIQLWRVDGGKELRKVEIEQGPVAVAALSPDGKLLAAATGGASVTLWNTATGKEVRRIAGWRGLGAFLSFSPDGKVLAAGTSDGVTVLWEAATGKRLAVCEGPTPRLAALSFTADGSARAWGVDGQTAFIWDVPSGKSSTPIEGHDQHVLSSAILPGGKQVVSASPNGTVCTWDAGTGKVLRRVQLRDDDARYVNGSGGGNQVRYSSLAVSPDGKHIAGCGSYTSTTRLWELSSGKVLCDFEGGRNDLNTVSFSPDGALVAVAGYDKTVRLWDVHTGQERGVLRVAEGNLRSPVFAPDGKKLAALNTYFDRGLNQEVSEVHVMETRTGKELRRFRRGNANLLALAFAPDGRTLATSGYGSPLTLWDVASGKELRQFGPQHHGPVPCLAFAPDGRTLVISQPAAGASAGGAVITVWEVATGQVRQRLEGHQGTVLCLTFSPDSRLLASGSSDTTLLLWDMTGRSVTGESMKQWPVAAQDKLWTQLGSPDAQAAYQALRQMRNAPNQAVPLLKKHLRSVEVSAAREKEIEQLIADLGDNRFPVRQKAHKALENLGELAAPSLRKALEKPGEADEQRMRVEKILQKVDSGVLSMNAVREVRAVEALEHMGTAEARQLLAALAGGASAARLTREAQEALRRMNDSGAGRGTAQRNEI